MRAWAPLAAIAAGRWLWARWLAVRKAGEPPGVRADDGVLLHACTEGDDADLTIVFAHGIAARLEIFEPQRAALRGRARLVLFDQRGHGRSGWSGPRAATIAQLGRDLGRVIDALGGDRVVVVGHSLGGMALLDLARRRPGLFGDRVAGVALLSTAAGGLLRDDAPGGAARAAVRTGAARLMIGAAWAAAPLLDAVHPLGAGFVRRRLDERLFGRGVPPPQAAETMEGMWAAMSESMAAAFGPAIATFDGSDGVQALRGIPALVLAGADDSTIPAEHSERIARALGGGARLVTIPGAGHVVGLTHPELVTEELVRLVNRVTP